MQVTCDSCPAEFDVTGKRPGSVFKCPRCGDGRIRVPEGSAGSEELEELPIVAETTEEASPAGGPDSEEEASDGGNAATARRRSSRGGASRSGSRKKASARSGSGRSSRSSGRDRAPSGGSKLSPAAMGAIAAAVIAVAVGGFFMMKDDNGDGGGSASASNGGASADGTSGSSSSGGSTAVKSIREIYEERVAALTPNDALGRSSLASYCLEKGMKAEALDLNRQALLIEPNLQTARHALGFTLYTGRAQQYKGRWLDKEDLAQAVATERFVTGDGLDASSTPTDIFMANAEAIKQQMLSEFPEDKWLYAYGPDMMQMPFLVLIERRGEEDDYRVEYRETLAALKESFYQKYQNQFGLEEITTPIRAVIFESTKTYNAHRANYPDAGYSEPTNILGYYMPSKQQLVMWRASGGSDWKGVLFHEGTHMFVHYAFSGAKFTPSTQTPWFQEGFAEYFGGYKVVEVGAGRDKKKTYELGFLLPGRWAQYQFLQGSGSLLTLEQMVKMSPADFQDARKPENQGDRDSRALIDNVYAQGWVMVMYLHYAQGGKYKAAFDAYFEAETKGAGNWATFAQLMDLNSPADWQDLEDDIREWADQELPKINKAS